MRILSPINENKDIVNKEYVDGHSGGSSDFKYEYYDNYDLWYSYYGVKTLEGIEAYDGTSILYYIRLCGSYTPDTELDPPTTVGGLLGYFMETAVIPDEVILDNDEHPRIVIEMVNHVRAVIELSYDSSSTPHYTVSSVHIDTMNKKESEGFIYSYDAYVFDGELEVYYNFITTEALDENSNYTEFPTAETVYNALTEKQDELVSGTNIKTINNQSLLGSGNISISGGSSTDVQINGTSIVNNDVANIVTNSAYNSSSNKIATMNDLPSVPVTDVQVNGTTAVSSGTVNLITNTAYNASSNKLATMSDLPSVPVTDVKVNNSSVVSSGVVDLKTNTAYNASSNKLATMSDIPSVPVTDIKINNTSILSNGSANIVTNTAYNASSNKIATMSDVPSVSDRLKVNARSAYDLNTCYDAGVYLVAQGSNIPSGSNYGSLLVMPYRKAEGNTTPDFGTQIFMPNGDDNTHPNSFYYRTALSGSWNSWQELETTTNKVTSISSSSTDAQYPSAKCVYDIIGDIESLLGGI